MTWTARLCSYAALLCIVHPSFAAQHRKEGKGKAAVDPAIGSKVMQQAIRLYEADHDYYNATIQFHKVIEGETGDNDRNRQRAEFFMAKTLYALKFYAPALSYFDRIAQKGPQHAYYSATLKWLAALSRELPESAGILERIGKYNKGEFEQPELDSVRNELYYLLGRYYYSQGPVDPNNFKEAIELFQRIPQSSEYYARAKFFEGVTRVRQNDGKAASEAFKDILRKHEENPDKATQEFVTPAHLALARTFYTNKQYPTSIKYFERIPQESPDWLDSLFESSWAYFQQGPTGYSKALGNIHTINAPYFENEFKPESLILKSVIYFYNCLYDRAAEAIAQFEQEYPPLKREIDEILAKHPDNTDFAQLAIKIREGTAGLPERAERAARGVLEDRTLLKQLGYRDELDRELQQVERAEPAWKSTAVAANVLQDLTLQKSLATNEIGNQARQRLKRLSDEIGELDKQRLQIDIEILNAQKGQLTQELMSEQETKANVTQAANVRVDDEHEYWPFRGEYWKDELGAYRVRIASQCKR